MRMDLGILAGLLLGFGVIVGFVIAPLVYYYELNQEKDDNFDEYGLEVTDKEINCWKVCNKNEYFYSPGGLFSSAVCECSIISNQSSKVNDNVR